MLFTLTSQQISFRKGHSLYKQKQDKDVPITAFPAYLVRLTNKLVRDWGKNKTNLTYEQYTRFKENHGDFRINHYH